MIIFHCQDRFEKNIKKSGTTSRMIEIRFLLYLRSRLRSQTYQNRYGRAVSHLAACFNIFIPDYQSFWNLIAVLRTLNRNKASGRNQGRGFVQSLPRNCRQCADCCTLADYYHNRGTALHFCSGFRVLGDDFSFFNRIAELRTSLSNIIILIRISRGLRGYKFVIILSHKIGNCNLINCAFCVRTTQSANFPEKPRWIRKPALRDSVCLCYSSKTIAIATKITSITRHEEMTQTKPETSFFSGFSFSAFSEFLGSTAAIRSNL
jgi:mRNA-degrading endonuclease toxin of MazEF toxin-antitoxin module